MNSSKEGSFALFSLIILAIIVIAFYQFILQYFEFMSNMLNIDYAVTVVIHLVGFGVFYLLFLGSEDDFKNKL